MNKKNVVKRLSGIIIVGALAVSVILPTQAAVARAYHVEYNSGYIT